MCCAMRWFVRFIDEALHGVVFTVAMTARLRDISIEVKTPREAMPLLLQQAATSRWHCCSAPRCPA